MQKDKFRINNFDLIRLFAALQVSVSHIVNHLEVKSFYPVVSFFSFFPGVPIFFFISGFLISKSYENNSDSVEYARNRILRIYPALIVCTCLSVISVWCSGYFSAITVRLHSLVIWILGQISIVQFYNPDFMRGFGTGVLNGSLWTITVELQFYIIIPILYWFFKSVNSRRKNAIILLLIFMFVVVHFGYHLLKNKYSELFLLKLWGVSFSPWLYMFLIGIVFQRNFGTLHRFLSERFVAVFTVYLLISFIAGKYLDWQIGHGDNPFLYIILSSTIFSFAYSYTGLSQRILANNDISYGLYIYHIPVLNLLMYYKYSATASTIFLSLAITMSFALLSWMIIEKPSMRWKKQPFNPLTVNQNLARQANTAKE